MNILQREERMWNIGGLITWAILGTKPCFHGKKQAYSRQHYDNAQYGAKFRKVTNQTRLGFPENMSLRSLVKTDSQRTRTKSNSRHYRCRHVTDVYRLQIPNFKKDVFFALRLPLFSLCKTDIRGGIDHDILSTFITIVDVKCLPDFSLLHNSPNWTVYVVNM